MNRLQKLKLIKAHSVLKEGANQEEIKQFLADIRGEQGLMGLPGEKGEKGANGLQGLPGRDGIDGSNGLPGIKGKDGSPGRDGIDGHGITWLGQWETLREYFLNNAVFNKGSAYICIAEHQSRYLTEPGLGNNWHKNWAVLAEKGEKGEGGTSVASSASPGGGTWGSITGNLTDQIDLINYYKAGGTGDIWVEKAGDTMTGDLISTGMIMASGAFNESTTTPGMYIGGPTTLGTPRFMLADGNASRNWQFDNNGGTFRAFIPGQVQWQTTLGGTSSFRDLLPLSNATYALGSASFYWTNLYASRLNLNSTAYIDGGTAGLAALVGRQTITSTGNTSATSGLIVFDSGGGRSLTVTDNNTVTVGNATADPDGWARFYVAGGGFRADDDFRFKKSSGSQYITRFGGTGYDLVFQCQSDQITLFGAGGMQFHQAVTITDAKDITFGTSTGTKIGTATSQKLAFYNSTPVAKQTGVAVTAAGIHAALVTLGLIGP